MRGHALGDDGPGADDAVVADGDPLEDHGAAADPDSVFDAHGAHDEPHAGDFVLVRVHDDHVARDLAVATDRDRTTSNDLRIAIQVRTRADADVRAWPTLDAHAAEEATIANFDRAAAVFDRGQRPAAPNDEDAGLLESGAQPEPEHVTDEAVGSNALERALNGHAAVLHSGRASRWCGPVEFWLSARLALSGPRADRSLCPSHCCW